MFIPEDKHPLANSKPKEQTLFTISYPSRLPIVDKREEIIRAIRQYPVIVITGDTGSGKSTQIPKMCLEAGRGSRGMIGCTQPRRVAATSIAARVMEEIGEIGRQIIGYQIRFQDKTSKATRIKFMTDGILLAETQGDPFLRRYDTIIIDEAHERSLNIDFLLGILRQLLTKRRDLKVIITSATIDTEKFSQSFQQSPIIRVEGRMYPVEVWYRPVNHALEESGDLTYIDQAVRAVDELKHKHSQGDMLIFMPTERDIRETQSRLEGRHYQNTLILPLFGRLSAADQNRIFHPANEQKIIVATNIAETSITVPGIKYVIDPGLARLSHYNARTHTQSLPVQFISQSSADQRKGRCGRVESGICIRLYSEDEYEAWPQFTLPEITRSNLARVILQMIFLNLGDINAFPFIDPPTPAAIKDGFAELRELGALDTKNQITSIGRLMARFPLDPRISRMLIEAKKEGALREITVIASALSIQDPRERPVEQEAKADQMHGTFKEPLSDFLTLLKIWDTYHETFEKCKTQNQMRKFCKTHFLSYNRMREWQDIHEQIISILDETGGYQRNEQAAGYEAVHKSILSGLLSHIALRLEMPNQKNFYQAARGREVMIFPGSGQFAKAGQWIVAAEIVRTSRLFARMVATIQPEWIEGLAQGLAKSSYAEPHWEKNRGQVVAYEQVTLFGLPIVQGRKVNYGLIKPQEAREIFIRSALVEGEVREKLSFLEHNRLLIDQIENWEEKTRRRDLLVDEETLFQFYEARITEPISDIRTFLKWLKDHHGDSFLFMKPEDIMRVDVDESTVEQFPDTLSVNGLSLVLTYKFEPGHEEDGATLHIPVHLIERIPAERLEWLVPGLLLEKITALLKSLPKEYRKQFIPLQQTAQSLFERISLFQGSLLAELERVILQLFRLKIPRSAWNEPDLPPHLRMRYVVLNREGKIISQGREITILARTVPQQAADQEWKRACLQWERDQITTWDFADLPEEIDLTGPGQGNKRQGIGQGREQGAGQGTGPGSAGQGTRQGREQGREHGTGQGSAGQGTGQGTGPGSAGQGIGLGECGKVAYPGLVAAKTKLLENNGVSLCLFHNQTEARQATQKGLLVLYALPYKDQLKELKKKWDLPPSWRKFYQHFGSQESFNEILFNRILQGIFPVEEGKIPSLEEFNRNIEAVAYTLAKRGWEIVEEIQNLLEEWHKTSGVIDRFRGLALGKPLMADFFLDINNQIKELLPPDFLMIYDLNRLRHLRRYLKAICVRVERAYASPHKDRLKVEQLAVHQERLAVLARAREKLEPSSQQKELVEEYRWMIEEWKVSLFAPEVGTAYPISAKRLEKKWEEISHE